MVVSFSGPLTLENRRYLDPLGFIVEFDADIPVNVFKAPIKAKLRLNNGNLRYYFAPGTIQVAVNVDFAHLPLCLSGRLRRNQLIEEGDKSSLFGDIVSIVLMPRTRLREIQHDLQFVLAGTVTASNNLYKMFYFDATQNLSTNYLEWDYHVNKTKIMVRAVINVRSFEGDSTIPSARSRVFVRGQLDDYHLDPLTENLVCLVVIVESLEILYDASEQEEHTSSVPVPIVPEASWDSCDGDDSEVDESPS